MKTAYGLLIAALVTVGLAGCGGDDDTVGASSSSTTSTTAMSMDDQGGALKENPCAPGGSGELPGMTMMTPSAGATPITITATEYKFTGTDALKAGGAFAVTFKNEGTELHELHVAKLADGETRPMDDIVADPTAESKTTAAGHSFACPGATAPAAGVNLTTPGRYIVLCYIPTGAKADTDPKDFGKLGMPHAMQGMAVEIDIS
jgi:hypothetical protein